MGGLRGRALKFTISFLTGFLIGGLVGVVFFSLLVTYKMDNYYKQISYLENTIENREERLEKLEQSINNQNIIVKDIEVNLTFDKKQINDEIDKIEIEKTIKDKYNSLLGKEVKTIDGHMLVEVVDKRILKIQDRQYKLEVDKLILTEIVAIWVRVEDLD